MVAIKTILQRSNNARDSVTTETDSTEPYTASGTIAAKSADPADGKNEKLFCRRKQKP